MTISVTHCSETDSFACLLDDQPGYLVPARLIESDGRDKEKTFLRNAASWVGSDPLPLGFGHGDGGTLWVRDRCTGARLPFAISRLAAQLLADRAAMSSLPSSVPADIREALILAGAFVDHDAEVRRQTEWIRAMHWASSHFAEHGYAPIAGLLHPLHLGELRRYFRYLLRTGRLNRGDGQSPLRHVAHNEPVARFFHRELVEAVSVIAGQTLKPSYVYLASYQGGARLPRHTDREQCHVSVTIAIDHTPEPDGAIPWPLTLQTLAGDVQIHQALGDALVYRGRDIPHSRSPLAEDRTSTSLFFHYVPESFAGLLD